MGWAGQVGKSTRTKERPFEWISNLKPEIAYLTHLSTESDHDAVTNLCPPGVLPAYDGLVINI